MGEVLIAMVPLFLLIFGPRASLLLHRKREAHAYERLRKAQRAFMENSSHG